MANPLDDFKTTSATAGSNDFKVEPYPKLSLLVEEYGFKRGIETFDAKLEEHRQRHERAINERLAGNLPASVSESNP